MKDNVYVPAADNTTRAQDTDKTIQQSFVRSLWGPMEWQLSMLDWKVALQ
jgi:hypothetical protein